MTDDQRLSERTYDRVTDGPLMDLHDQLVEAIARQQSTVTPLPSTRRRTGAHVRRQLVAAAAAVVVMVGVTLFVTSTNDDARVAADVTVEQDADGVTRPIAFVVAPGLSEPQVIQALRERLIAPHPILLWLSQCAAETVMPLAQAVRLRLSRPVLFIDGAALAGWPWPLLVLGGAYALAVLGMPLALLATSPWTAAVLIGLGLFAHHGFSTNVFGMTADIVPTNPRNRPPPSAFLAAKPSSMWPCPNQTTFRQMPLTNSPPDKRFAGNGMDMA